MATNYNLMSQLVFKLPFKTKYYEQDYYVSSNNFSAYRLIESWPNWPSKWVNIFGPKGCGKTHLSNILKKKINLIHMIDAKKVDNEIISKFEKLDCLIIDNYEKNIDEKIFYSLLNQSKQSDSYLLVNSILPLGNIKFDLKDSTTIYYESGSLSEETSWDIVVPNDKIEEVKKFIEDNT